MQLVEQGKLSLDDPINDRLPPSLRIPDDGFHKPILVRHLMTHTAGFEDSLEDLFVPDPEKLLSLDESLAALIVSTACASPERSPSTRTTARRSPARSSPTSTGEPWQDYAERRILRPLGMATATYREPYPERIAAARGLTAADVARDPRQDDERVLLVGGRLSQAQPFEYVTNYAPVAAMSASANDMAAYLQALLDPERMAKAGVLKAETALALREPLFPNTPELAPVLHGFLELGATRGRRGFGHSWIAVAFQKSTMEIYPEEGFAIFLSANTPAGGTLLDELPELLLDALLPDDPSDAATREGPASGGSRRSLASIARCACRPIAARRRRSATSANSRCDRCQAATSRSQAAAATSRSAKAFSVRSRIMIALPFMTWTGA